MDIILNHGDLLLTLALLFGLFMAWGVGANDVANAMGTSVGSKAITVKQAIIIAIIFEFSGALLAGGEVTATIRKGILDAADAAFTIETWTQEDNCITFNCTKMRSAKMEGFTSVMDWETLKIGPQSTMNPKDRAKIRDAVATGEEIHDAV